MSTVVPRLRLRLNSNASNRAAVRNSALAFCVICGLLQPSVFAQGPPASPVVVIPAIEQTLRTGQTFVATIYPEQRATIGSAVDGRVVRFPVNEGDRVSNGQALAELLTETIKLELEAAEGELQFRKQELVELQNGTRKEDIDQAKAQTQAAATAVTLSEKRLERISELIKSRTASRDQLDESQAALDNAAAMLAERKAAEALAVAGPRGERIAQAKARVAIQKAMVEKLSDQIKKHTMVARFDGYVVAEHTEIGQWVNRGDAVAEIIGIDRVHVTASVLETHVPFISVGMEARVEVPAIPDRVFIGKVVIVVPQGDARSRTFPVKVELENEFKGTRPLLNAGMLARVTLPTGVEKTSLMVPKDALVLGGPQPMVYVVDDDPKEGKTVRPLPVSLGAPSGVMIEVQGDLQAGQLVVVQGNERLRPGQSVSVLRKVTPENFAGKSKETSAEDSATTAERSE